LKTHVSLGVFDLPPGNFLRDGDRFDVFAEAAGRQNPGAARWFGIPAPDADVGVPLIRDYGRTQPPLSPESTPIPSPETPRKENPDTSTQGPTLPPLPR
jgi:hypothetical protein